MPGVRRQAQEGVLPGGDRLQGLGLLPHGQPEKRHGRGSGDQGEGQVAAESSSSTSDSGSSNGSADKAAAKKAEPAKSSSASEKVA